MKSRKLFLLLGILATFVLLLLIYQAYAKYLSSADGNTNIPIAKWNILVNNLSIKTNTDISSSIIPVFPGNEHIASNIIAPSAEGYFDLAFDFSNADVSFRYTINCSSSDASSVKDIVATGYSVDGGPKITFSNYNEPITDTILLQDHIPTRNIRVYIKWNDDTSASMNNVADTLSTTSSNPVIFHTTISFTQITETPIVP